MSRRLRGAEALIGMVLLIPLSGCGGGSESGASPQPSLSLLPSRTLPSPTRAPDRTDQPGPTPSAQPSRSRTAEPGPTEIPTTTEPSPTPETTAATPSTDASAPADGSTSAADDGSSDDGVPPWVWWLVAVLLVGGVVTALLLARARRRRKRREALMAAESDIAWLSRELIPTLRSTGSLEQVAGGWQVGLPRISALEDQLTVLESSTTAADDAARARTLRDAVRTARARVDSLTAGGPSDAWALDLDETVALLEAALAPAREPR